MGHIKYWGQRHVGAATMEASFPRASQRSEGQQSRNDYPQHKTLTQWLAEKEGAPAQGRSMTQQTNGDMYPFSTGAPPPPKLFEITAKLPPPQTQGDSDEEPVDMQVLLRRTLILEIQGMLRNHQDGKQHMPQPPADDLQAPEPPVPRFCSGARRPGQVNTAPELPKLWERSSSSAQLSPAGRDAMQTQMLDVWRKHPVIDAEPRMLPVTSSHEAFPRPSNLGCAWPGRVNTEPLLPPPPDLSADEGKGAMQMHVLAVRRHWPDMNTEPRKLPVTPSHEAFPRPSTLGCAWPGRVNTEPLLPPPPDLSADEVRGTMQRQVPDMRRNWPDMNAEPQKLPVTPLQEASPRPSNRGCLWPGRVNTEPLLPPPPDMSADEGKGAAQTQVLAQRRNRPDINTEPRKLPVSPSPEAFPRPGGLGCAWPGRVSTEPLLPPPPDLSAEEGRRPAQARGLDVQRQRPCPSSELRRPQALHRPSNQGCPSPGRVNTEPVLPPPPSMSADEENDVDLHRQLCAAMKRAHAERRVKFQKGMDAETSGGPLHEVAQHPGVPLVPGIQPAPHAAPEAPAGQAAAINASLIPHSRPLLPPGLVVRDGAAGAPASSSSGPLAPKC